MEDSLPIASLPHGDDRLHLYHSTAHLANKGDDPHAYDEEDAADEYDSSEELEYTANARGCCSCCWVVDELLHHKKKADAAAFGEKALEGVLPRWAIRLLQSGQMHTALVLAIYFSPQQGGRENPKMPQIGETSKIKAADGMEEQEELTYLGYEGKNMASGAIWVDHWDDVTTVYINLNALIPSGIRPLYSSSFVTTDASQWYGKSFSVLNFTQEHLLALWYEYDLRGRLFGDVGLVWEYPGAQFIFTGYSHGAPMAQGIGMLFTLETRKRRAAGDFCGSKKEPIPYVIDWNGYRWIQEDGKTASQEVLGNQQVNFTSVRRWNGYVHYDPTGGFPANGCNSPNTFALDIDSSRIEKIDSAPDLHRDDAIKLRSLDWFSMHAIHIKAVRRLTTVYGCRDD